MSKGFLKVAERLYESGRKSRGENREFLFRSAISRAYYGVLWYIRDFYGLKGTDLHGMARSVLEKKHLYTEKEELRMLGKARNQADYQENSTIKFDEKTVRHYIYIARKIVRSQVLEIK